MRSPLFGATPTYERANGLALSTMGTLCRGVANVTASYPNHRLEFLYYLRSCRFEIALHWHRRSALGFPSGTLSSRIRTPPTGFTELSAAEPAPTLTFHFPA